MSRVTEVPSTDPDAPTLGEPTRVPPVDELEHLIRAGLFFAVVEHLHDAGVVQPRSDARLVEEHARELGVTRDVGQQTLDGDAPLEAVRAADEPFANLRHATFAERGAELETHAAHTIAQTRAGPRAASGASRGPVTPQAA